MRIPLLFISYFLLLANVSYSQKKYEKEIRIDRNEVHVDAQEFIKSVGYNKKIKWYKEIGIDKTSIEAKTCYRRKEHSIEFNIDGHLEDVEVKIKKKDMPSLTWTAITRFLSSKYRKYKVDKIQVQYTGPETSVLQYIKDEIVDEGLVINYEIVLSAKVDHTYKLIEYLFSEDGEPISDLEIMLKNTDNIEY